MYESWGVLRHGPLNLMLRYRLGKQTLILELTREVTMQILKFLHVVKLQKKKIQDTTMKEKLIEENHV